MASRSALRQYPASELTGFSVNNRAIRSKCSLRTTLRLEPRNKFASKAFRFSIGSWRKSRPSSSNKSNVRPHYPAAQDGKHGSTIPSPGRVRSRNDIAGVLLVAAGKRVEWPRPLGGWGLDRSGPLAGSAMPHRWPAEGNETAARPFLRASSF